MASASTIANDGRTNATPTTAAPSAPPRAHPRYIASCAASGPGASWASASPSRYSSSLNHRRSSTRSRCMKPTSAMGPPNPVVPSWRKYRARSASENADAADAGEETPADEVVTASGPSPSRSRSTPRSGSATRRARPRSARWPAGSRPTCPPGPRRVPPRPAARRRSSARATRPRGPQGRVRAALRVLHAGQEAGRALQEVRERLHEPDGAAGAHEGGLLAEPGAERAPRGLEGGALGVGLPPRRAADDAGLDARAVRRTPG